MSKKVQKMSKHLLVREHPFEADSCCGVCAALPRSRHEIYRTVARKVHKESTYEKTQDQVGRAAAGHAADLWVQRQQPRHGGTGSAHHHDSVSALCRDDQR